MRTRRLFVAIFSLIFIISSCHTDCECGEFTTSPVLIGFSSQETDTIIVRRHLKRNNFSSVIDSFKLYNTNGFYLRRNDSLRFSSTLNGNGFAGRDDYSIHFPSSGLIKRLELNVDFRNGSCGRCSNSLKDYTVNGINYKPSFIFNDTSDFTRNVQVYIHK
ncbi:MAG: hypothetical protein JWR72_1673 [Flavisolibacter sp.]|nr:hypothetical protein [Flavisolibacter sp.]